MKFNHIKVKRTTNYFLNHLNSVSPVLFLTILGQRKGFRNGKYVSRLKQASKNLNKQQSHTYVL